MKKVITTRLLFKENTRIEIIGVFLQKNVNYDCPAGVPLFRQNQLTRGPRAVGSMRLPGRSIAAVP